MPLTNEQYDQIMHIYDGRRLDRLHEADRRKQTLLAAVPGLSELEDEIRRTAIRAVGLGLKEAALQREAGGALKGAPGGETSYSGEAALTIDALSAQKQKLIEEAGYAVSLTDVLAVEVPDRPGGLADMLLVLSDSGIGIEYLYSFVRSQDGKALIVFRVSDNDKAREILSAHQIPCLSQEEMEKL